MPDIQIQCPHCGTTLVGDTDEAGALYPCPNCGKEVQIPAARPSVKAPTPKIKIASSTRQCPHCGEVIQRSAIKCKFCGEFLTGKDRLPSSGLQHISSYQSAPQKVERPACVSIAVFFLFAQLLIGLFRMVFDPTVKQFLNSSATSFFYGFITVLFTLLLIGVAVGIGWCRVLYIILDIIGFVLIGVGLFVILQAGQPIPLTLLDAVGWGLHFLAFCLLASNTAGRWYRAKADGRAT